MSLTLNDFHICHIRVQFINLFWFDFTMFYFSPPKPNFQFHVGEAKHVYRKLRCRSICEVWVQSFVQPVRAFSSTTGKACVLNHCHTAHGKGIFKFRYMRYFLNDEESVVYTRTVNEKTKESVDSLSLSRPSFFLCHLTQPPHPPLQGLHNSLKYSIRCGRAW